MPSLPIQSVDSPFELSTDNSTWKVLVCIATYTLNIDTPTTTTNTQCGPFIGLGFTTFNATMEIMAVYDKSGTQVNQKDVLNWVANRTLLYFRIQSPANGGSYPIGNAYFASGQGYLTNTTLQNATDAPVKFTVTFTGQGQIDVTE